ncbi:hypothetical protein [Streptomyces sp. MNP-20]|uniref:hypothetical protein n=1 Tax=Streptomyces sp. MNP-20 TaxID=2721165 RepID=UPI0015542861|nr:hypothetical protein [Streptomyces sp. MNP-20]
MTDSSTTPHACSVCLYRLHQTVTRLPYLYVQLHLALPHGTPRRRIEWAATHLPWTARDRPPPLRLSLLAHAEHCVTVLRTWAEHAAPDTLPDAAVRPGHLLQTICRTLAGNLPAYVATTTDGQHAGATWTAYTRARQLLDHDEPAHRLKTPCPFCSLRALSISSDDTITCRSCRVTWPAQNNSDT